jgi:hypothetical protein
MIGLSLPPGHQCANPGDHYHYPLIDQDAQGLVCSHPRNPVGLHDRVLGRYGLPGLEFPGLDTGADDRRYLEIAGDRGYRVKIIRHASQLRWPMTC